MSVCNKIKKIYLEDCTSLDIMYRDFIHHKQTAKTTEIFQSTSGLYTQN